jgi:hypothetical protein
MYIFFNIINIDEIYLLLKKLNIFNSLKYKADPIANRNSILTWSSSVYNIYYKLIKINIFIINYTDLKLIIIFKNICYSIIIYFICLLYFRFNFNKDTFIKKLLSNGYMYKRAYIKKDIFINIIKIMFFYINLIFINIIYFC